MRKIDEWGKTSHSGFLLLSPFLSAECDVKNHHQDKAERE